ncbi:MAG: hypothetical protein RLZZ337_99 [Bacteroidota bacterium]|jgi:thiamine pyrophosphokinase
MSSHHFVKEGQEPALIIANGQECAYTLLSQLLEWCPFVVVLDGAYKRVKDLQIKPDIVIGDFDSLPEIHRDEDVQFIKLEEQETTDLEKAISHLKDIGYTDINVVWATGKRLDHTINNFSILGKNADLNIVLYDDYSRAFALPKTYKKHYATKFKLSLFPMGEVSGIKTSNLAYNLDDESLKMGGRSGSSNWVQEDGIVEIKHDKGTLILIESKDEI